MPSTRRKKSTPARLVSEKRPQLLLSAAHCDLREAAGYMAALAIFAKAPAMNIITAMAINALASTLRRIASPHVTGRTDQAFVLALQRKIRLLVVIEGPRFPIHCTMAHAARGRSA